MGKNLFLFKFATMRDKDRILDGGPWAYNNQMLAFCDFNGELRPEEYRFDKAMFWIRISGLTWNLMSMDMAERLGNNIGSLVKVDHSTRRGSWAEDLRIQVTMDITKPLRRFISIARGCGKEDIRGRLTYERLPLFCYVCGIIGHTKMECKKTHSNGEGGEVKQYGDWLRERTGNKNNGDRLSNIHRNFLGDSFQMDNQSGQRRTEQQARGGHVESWSLTPSNPVRTPDESSGGSRHLDTGQI